MIRNLSRVLLCVLLGGPAAGWAADTDGLDLTIEVLGKDEAIDERIVNRIEVPGVPLDQPAADPLASPVTGAVGQTLQQPLGLVQDLARDALQLLRPRDDAAK